MRDMTKRLTRAEQKAQTRAQLLGAADRLFEQQGYAATTLAQIAEEAGLTKGAVYSNFASKEELFLEMLEHGDSSCPATSRCSPTGPEPWPNGSGLSAKSWLATILLSLEQRAMQLELRGVALRNPEARGIRARCCESSPIEPVGRSRMR